MFRALFAIAVLSGCSAPRQPPELHSLSSNRPPLTASVLHVGFTVSNLDRAARDFARLDFKPGRRRKFEGESFETLLHLAGARAQTLELTLGQETIELVAFESEQGRAIPFDSRSNDAWFQHLAIVVSDMDAAYTRVARGFASNAATAPAFYATSPTPQRIPLSNPNAGGVRAFYFQDSDHHNLELIWFPPGKGRPRWQAPLLAPLFLGIDHSAIATSNTELSLGTYRDALGLKIGGTSLNFGAEQQALSGVGGARVRITGLRADAGPGVEFLQYLEPGPGRPQALDTRANDLWHWEITILVNDIERVAQAIEAHGGRRVSTRIVDFGSTDLDYRRALLMTDPDGHALRLVQR